MKCPSCSKESKSSTFVCEFCGSVLSKPSNALVGLILWPIYAYLRITRIIHPVAFWLGLSSMLAIFSGLAAVTFLPPEVLHTPIERTPSVVEEDGPDFSTKPGVCEVHRPVGRMMIEWAAQYPEEARVPGCSEFSLRNLYGEVYELRGYIIAPNGFGVEDRINFTVRMTYKGDAAYDMSNWEFEDPIIY